MTTLAQLMTGTVVMTSADKKKAAHEAEATGQTLYCGSIVSWYGVRISAILRTPLLCRVKMFTSYVGWHHRFLSVVSAWFYPGLGIYNNICPVWMVVLLLQQVLPMDDAILVSFSCFRGYGEENRCF